VSFGSCDITAEAREAAMEVLSSGWVTTGPSTAAFEQEFAAWVGAEHAIAVSSCTAAIELSLRALRLPPGSVVLSPTLTFCGAVHAIRHAGLRPVLLDVDEATLTATPDDVAAAAERHGARAMVVQHMAGYPAPVTELAAAAGLPPGAVVEDAAHGLGAATVHGAVGTGPTTACFSFYATKNLPIGEGGAITTADPELAELVRQSRQHGMSRDAWRRYGPGGGWRYNVEVDGLKANFTDLQAAIGRAQLRRLAEWQERRGALAAHYDAALRHIPGVTLPPRPLQGRHAWHLYVIRVAQPYPLTRDALATALAECGIGTSVHFIPVHHFPFFREVLGAPNLPVADRVFPQLLSLPLHPRLDEDDVDHVCGLIAAFGLGGPQ
jgi:dTDP-4-amino-4,6-dideoxygalactose transaminase